MKSDEGKNLLTIKARVYKEQLITVSDLEAFKNDLLHELKELLQRSPTQAAKKWLRSSEVRKLLSISAGTLQSLRIKGTLTFTKIGGIFFYDYEDILKLLNSHAGEQPTV